MPSRFNTKLDVLPSIWDGKMGKATGRTSEASRINRMLDDINASLNTIYHEIQQRDNYVTAEKVKNKFLGHSESHETILTLFQKHKDEEDVEYMFQDYENIPEVLISESWISENFFALRDAVEDLSDTEQEAFFLWCNYKSRDLGEEDADDLVRDFRDEYQGEYDDEEDFAYEIIEECYDLPEFAKTYFDYKQFARDLFMCDYWFDDGFVFRAA